VANFLIVPLRAPVPSKLRWGGRVMLLQPHSEAERVGSRESRPIPDDEDEETLAAIGEGIRDSDAGRSEPADEVRRLLTKWTSV
jgi:hypothetical protein